MAISYDHITLEQMALISESPVFFIASAAPDMRRGAANQGPVNLSPKGGSPLHVIDEHRVAYLDYTGSGNQTAEHARVGGPVTIMVMSMNGKDAAIVRLFGRATVAALEESPLRKLMLSAPAESIELPMRQVIEVAVESTQTSCGYGVPVLEFKRQRVRTERGRRYQAS
jgi:hypothetical protein